MGQLATMSENWLPALAAPVLEVVAWADIWSGIGGTLLEQQVPVTAGQVTIDRGNTTTRRQATNITFLPDAAGLLLPTTTGSGLLYPMGAEIALYKGVRYANGSTEVAALGRFLLSEVDVNRDSSGVTLVGTMGDRGQTIDNAEFAAPYVTNGSSTVDEAIMAMISSQVSGLLFSFTPSVIVPPPQSFLAGDGPWTSAQQLAAGCGLELFPDENGTIVLQPIPSPYLLPVVASYIEGTPLAPVGFKRQLENTTAPNVVLVIASGSGIPTPLQYFWWDNNPSSPTFYATGSPPSTSLPARSSESVYPTLMVTINTTIPPNTTDIEAVATAAGNGFIGRFESAQISLRDNPAHDVDDVVQVQSAVSGVPTPTAYVVDQVQIGLDTTSGTVLTGRLVVT